MPPPTPDAPTPAPLSRAQEAHLRFVIDAGGSARVTDGRGSFKWSRSCVACLERQGLVTVERGKGAPLVTVTKAGSDRLPAAGGATP